MTHSDIINNWPTLSDFADDLGVPYGTAKAMRRRSSIPTVHWPLLISKARDRAISGVTLETLVEAVAKHTEAAE